MGLADQTADNFLFRCIKYKTQWFTLAISGLLDVVMMNASSNELPYRSIRLIHVDDLISFLH